MDSDQVSILMTAATNYANSMNAIFTMLLTVIFGSLAFSAAISLRDIGRPYKLFGGTVSSSSILISVMLLAFYGISFYMFEQSAGELRVLLNELYCQTFSWEFANDITHEAFSPGTPSPFFDLGYPSVGYVIGSFLGLVSFIWLSNVDRSSRKSTLPAV